jgi:alpha-galactosidase
MITTLSAFRCGDTEVRYRRDPHGHVALELVPVALLDRVVEDDRGWADAQATIDLGGLVHVKLVGEAYAGGFAPGRTLRSAPAAGGLVVRDQREVRDHGGVRVVTTLATPAGLVVEHHLEHRAGDQALRIHAEVRNETAHAVRLELVTSFALSGISPFARDDAPGRLRLHRLRSFWSAEGRHEDAALEELHLERSWAGNAAIGERFGQVGSMPVRGFVPFAAVEDRGAGVMWGAQIATPGSWQMEVWRRYDHVHLSGGQADREFGHWLKTLAPGALHVTPVAHVACAAGDPDGGQDGLLDALAARLTGLQRAAADSHPAIERDLPIVCNEYCTTWGDPSHGKLMAIADRLRGTPTRFLVIDAGWYKTATSTWWNAHGDWIPSPELFPQGLAHIAAEIRKRGLIPGLWFELETVGPASRAWHQTAHLLKRDGVPYEANDRRFWDMADPWVVEYLSERVIGLLRSCGIGYIKIDYNENLGMGVDHGESFGEGLCRTLAGTQAFFRRLRRELPELVIENCASGGHRLEPSMLALSAQSSFSDAHECAEIPIVAAHVQRFVLPRQSQIWAVLKAADSDRRLRYSLAATFLGRMALSGEIPGLSAAQWATVVAAQRMYGEAAPVIMAGRSRLHRQGGASWRHASGWQGVVRVADDGRSALVVAHAFANPGAATLSLPMPPGAWTITGRFADQDAVVAVGAGVLSATLEPWSAAVVLLRKG